MEGHSFRRTLINSREMNMGLMGVFTLTKAVNPIIIQAG